MSRILLVEPSVPVARALEGYLADGGHEVVVAPGADEAQAAAAAVAPDVVCAGVSTAWDGEVFCRKWRRSDERTPVLLFYPPDAMDADARAQHAGANACVVGPLKQGTMLSAIRMLLRIRELEASQAQGGPAEPASARPGRAAPPLVVEDATFARLLQLETRRARRYGYPATLLAVGLDPPRAEPLAADEMEAVRAEARAQVTQAVRDTDLVTELDADRFLVLLPYTVPHGASRVAERLRSRLFGLRATMLTASVGLVPFDLEAQIAEPAQAWIADALEALARAQGAGGDQVVQAPAPAP